MVNIKFTVSCLPDRGSRILLNVGIYIPEYVVSPSEARNLIMHFSLNKPASMHIDEPKETKDYSVSALIHSWFLTNIK
jgi:hypothetical protein